MIIPEKTEVATDVFWLWFPLTKMAVDPSSPVVSVWIASPVQATDFVMELSGQRAPQASGQNGFVREQTVCAMEIFPFGSIEVCLVARLCRPALRDLRVVLRLLGLVWLGIPFGDFLVFGSKVVFFITRMISTFHP